MNWVMSHSRELKWRIEWPDFRIKCAGLHVKLQLIYSDNEMMPIHLDNKFQHTHFDTICNRFASTSNYSFPSHSCNFLLYLYLLSPHSHISLSIHSHFRVFPSTIDQWRLSHHQHQSVIQYLRCYSLSPSLHVTSMQRSRFWMIRSGSPASYFASESFELNTVPSERYKTQIPHDILLLQQRPLWVSDMFLTANKIKDDCSNNLLCDLFQWLTSVVSVVSMTNTFDAIVKHSMKNVHHSRLFDVQIMAPRASLQTKVDWCPLTGFIGGDAPTDHGQLRRFKRVYFLWEHGGAMYILLIYTSISYDALSDAKRLQRRRLFSGLTAADVHRVPVGSRATQLHFLLRTTEVVTFCIWLTVVPKLPRLLFWSACLSCRFHVLHWRWRSVSLLFARCEYQIGWCSTRKHNCIMVTTKLLMEFRRCSISSVFVGTAMTGKGES